MSSADLGPTSVNAAELVILDLLGVTLAATAYPVGRMVTDYVAGAGEEPRATVLGAGLRASTSAAAFANGVMAADMELDDVHSESNLHASSVFVPALLAVAEERDATGTDLITALVAAYDVGCRVSIAMDSALLYARGFHPTAVAGIFGAAAGAARLLGGGPREVERSLGLAAVQASGLLTWQTEQGHFTKSFQSGVAARNAVLAAELVSRGYDAPPGAFEDPRSVLTTFSTGPEGDRLVAGLGDRFEIEHTGFKFYSACRNIHSTLDAVLDLAHQVPFGPTDIDRIEVTLPSTMATLVDNNTLTTHNLQYIVAAALTDGEITRRQTAPERRADPALVALAARVRLARDKELDHLFPTHLPAQVAVYTLDGAVHEAVRQDPRGTGEEQVDRSVVTAKFRKVAGSVLSAGRVRSIEEAVASLTTMASVRDLTRQLGDHPLGAAAS
jgi:2-methylcitrate dehydratase PrpD